MTSPLHQASVHASAHLHVTGEAQYVDDFPAPAGLLVGMTLPSPYAHARVLSIDTSEAKEMPGIVTVLTSKDIPGDPKIGPIFPRHTF